MHLSKLFEKNKISSPGKTGKIKNLFLKKQIFSILYHNERKTIADLCIHVGISIPSMTRIMHELMDEGWVSELGTGESSGGRRPMLYGLNPTVRYILGIEITRKYTRINAFNLQNKAIGNTLRIDTELDNAPGTLIELKSHIDQYIEKYNLDKKNILGAGISIPGLIDKKSNISYTYPNLGQKPLDVIFEDLLKIPVYTEHDTKAMALGESWFGLARNRSDVLCLNVGSGIGLGMIINGKLYQGFSGFSGEFGHIQMVPDGELCECGKIGCLETVASGSAIVAKVKQMIESGTNSVIRKLVDDKIDNIKLPVIIKAAHHGDQFAIELIEESGDYLARGLASLIHLLNPEMIIIGGDIAAAENLILDPIKQKLNKYTIGRIRQDAGIFISELKEHAVLMGTIPVVMNRIFSDEPYGNNIQSFNKS